MAFEAVGLPPAADPKGPKPSVGRRFFDSLQKSRGRQPLRYQFEVVPLSVGGLPADMENVSLVWERGTKIQYTEPASIDPKYGTAIFNEILCQSATVYKEGNRFVPKEFVFKLQVVRHQIGQEHRKTVAKVKVDLSAFCTNTTAPQQQQLAWDLKPYGRLVLSLTTTWLHNITADDDQKTDGSFLTAMSGPSFEREDVFPQFDLTPSSTTTTPATDTPPSRSHRRTLSTGGLPSFGMPPMNPSPPPRIKRTPSMDFEFTVAEATKDLWGADLKSLPSGAHDSPQSHLSPQPLLKAESAPVSARSHQRSRSVGARPRPSGNLQIIESPKAPWIKQSPPVDDSHTRDQDLPAEPKALENEFRAVNVDPSVAKESKRRMSRDEHSLQRNSNNPFSLKALHGPDTDPQDALKLHPHTNLRINPIPSPRSREEAAKELLSMVSPTTPDMQTHFVEKVQHTVTTTATTVSDMFRHIMRRTGLAVPRSTAVMMDNITAETDINRLKRLARTLLLERDEFQAKFMQNEQLTGNLQLEVDNLKNQKAALQERLQAADANIAQLRDSALLRTLVDTKVQLAQTDLELNELKGALWKERGRVRQLAARLTSTQTKLDQLANQHPAEDMFSSMSSSLQSLQRRSSPSV